MASLKRMMMTRMLILLVIVVAGVGGWVIGHKQSNSKSLPSIDQKAAITEAVDNYCKTVYFSKVYPAQSVKDVFKITNSKFSDWHVDVIRMDENLFKKTVNTISVEASCKNSKLTDDQNGSGFTAVLVKRSNETWLVVSAEQMVPSCERLDGFGIPSDFIKCRDVITQKVRDPR